MDKCLLFLSVTLVTLLLFVSNGDSSGSTGRCSWQFHTNSTCSKINFWCANGKCIEREMFCNGVDDCGDRSDEKYCHNSYNCGGYMVPCPQQRKCIAAGWFCDGIRDCYDGRDEDFCIFNGTLHDEHAVRVKALKWIDEHRTNQSAMGSWSPFMDRVAVALYLGGNMTKTIGHQTRKELAYEVSNQLLSRLTKGKLQDIPSTDLASYVNAFLVTCLDPRKFHGLDIVQELRSRVDRQNHTNPYVMLSLCNAGVTITESDKMKLIFPFWAKHMASWADMKAGVLMALVCASRQPGSEVDPETMRQFAVELTQQQDRYGMVENLKTTALVMQALLAAELDSDPRNFDDTKAMQQLMSMQKSDGSFGSFLNTYYVLPVLNCMSLADIGSDHCEPYHRDEISAIDDLINKSGPKIRVQYSLWIGNDQDVEKYLALKVPADISLYEIMEMAAEIDSRYRFERVVKNGKPYVNALSGLQDDPEKGKFWFLYTVVDGKPSPSKESPVDVKPKENDHFAMWYREWSLDHLTD